MAVLKIFCILFIITNLNKDFVKAQSNPRIINISKDKEVNCGDKIYLQCIVDDIGDGTVIWKKIDYEDPSSIVLLSFENKIAVSDPRLSTRLSIQTVPKKSYTLQIEGIQESDAAIYQCEIHMKINHIITEKVSVQVFVSPYLVQGYYIRPRTAHVGENLILECYAYGYPKPSIYWIRQPAGLLPNGEVSHDGNKLSILNITKDDEGIYSCIAVSTFGKPDRRDITVTVEKSR